MIRSLWCWLAAILLGALPAAASAQASARIVAVGDLHGDYEAWIAIARAAGLMDGRGHWAGGRTVLVQTGDLVDRGPDSRKIIDSIMRLQREAQRAGGRVHVLNGNHEAMMVTGDLRYVHPGEYAAFATADSALLRDRIFDQQRAAFAARIRASERRLSNKQIRDEFNREVPLGLIEHQRAWHPETGDYGRWAAGNPVILKLGDTLFVHGGLSAEYSQLSIDEINRRAAAEMRARKEDESALINDALGPLWYRGLVTRDRPADEPPVPAGAVQLPPRPTIEQELAMVLAATGAKRMVVGHTPSLTGIVIGHGGRLIRIDTGISRYYGGLLSYLEIIGERLIPHVVPRPPGPAGGRRP